MENLKKKSPSLKKIFTKAAVTATKNTVTLALLHGGATFLKQKGTDKEITSAVSQKLGRKITLKFTENLISPVELKIENAHSAPPAEKKSSESIPRQTEECTEEPTEIPCVEVRENENLLPKIAPNSAEVLCGKLITKEPIAIREVNAQTPSAVIWGDVFLIDTHETKDGKNVIYSIYITDYTGSMILKIIENKKKAAYLEGLKVGKTILVQGDIAEDKYERELVIRPKNMNFISKYKVVDNAPKKRVELHLHTNMSAMDGVNTAAELITRAADWGQTAVAITDHGVAQAYPEAMNTVNALKKSGKNIKLIYGIEAYFVN